MTSTTQPRITIITPNFNCGRYLEQTIESVISQGYENLQYIVIDGGSHDGSIDIIRKYERHLDRWVSEPDGGAAEAISKGFAMADGDWINWLNSDDYLLPGALAMLSEIIAAAPGAQWVTGTRVVIDEAGRGVRPGGDWYRQNITHLLRDARYAQESTFLRRSFYERVGGINVTLRSIFDRELYLRMLAEQLPVFTPAVFGVIRIREGQLSRDEEQRGKDYPKLTKLYHDRPRYMRLIDRATHTRFRPLLTAAVDAAFKLGLFPIARDLRVVTFDENKSEWINLPYYKFL